MRTTVLIAVLAAGCVGELEEPVEITNQALGECPPVICSKNTDVLTRIGTQIWEANVNGLPDINRVSLVTRPGTSRTNWVPRAQIWDENGRAYDLKVTNGKLSGTAVVGTGKISGQSLINAGFKFQKDGKDFYTVMIDNVHSVPMRVGTPDLIEVYELSWYPAGTSNVMTTACEGVDGYLNPNDSVIFEGDRINVQYLTMSDDAHWDPSWFNIGCATSALGKLRLLRETTKNQQNAQGQLAPNWRLRQSALKMMTADYCGTGHSYTDAGVSITWADREGIVKYPLSMGIAPSVTKVEARWDERGATCLTGTRRSRFDIDAVYAECGYKASCFDTGMTTPPLDMFWDTQVISAIP